MPARSHLGGHFVLSTVVQQRRHLMELNTEGTRRHVSPFMTFSIRGRLVAACESFAAALNGRSPRWSPGSSSHPMDKETRVKWVASYLSAATNEAIVVRFCALRAGNVPKTHNDTLAISGFRHVGFGCKMSRDSLFCYEWSEQVGPDLM